jgi:hypothetical protein
MRALVQQALGGTPGPRKEERTDILEEELEVACKTVSLDLKLLK